jgi:enamine deaminase RidA (YjgF/YER057c/UK114 family)
MGRIETKLKEMGYDLPPVFVYPSPNRCGCTRVGNVLYLSGHGLGLPLLPGVRQRGRVGAEISEAEGYATARAVALTMLSTVKAAIGDLDGVRKIVRLFGMVNCEQGFERMPAVIDGASDLFYELFGPEIGQHARSAVGQVSLPHRIAVEINGEIEVEPVS